MNEADFPSINLDELRLVPDWLREATPAPSKQYASYDRPVDYDDQNRRRAPRPGGGGSDRRNDRGGRDRRPGPERNDRPMRGTPPGRPEFSRSPREDFPAVAAAPIRVEFLPDERCMASIIKQIRSTHLAYPLFSLARMFLQEPARHYLQLSIVPGTLPPGAALHQLGEDGPVTLSRAPLEASAFDAMKERYYKEETVQKDPPKGNFSNVARERLSGVLLGPTNYHGYQPALRALYESRYSRRMSFDEYRRNVEVSSDPALIERWKEDARTATTISTVEGEPPTVFTSNAEARTHFRQHYLESSLHQGMSFRLHGSVARRLPEPAVMQAIREAHERELRYPAQFVQLLRQGLQNAGLHIFKHRKRIVYVAATRPTPFIASRGTLTENISLILETITEFPLCTRKMLADRVLSKKSGGKVRRVVDDAGPSPAENIGTLPEMSPAALPANGVPTPTGAEPTNEEPANELAPTSAAELMSTGAPALPEPVASVPSSKTLPPAPPGGEAAKAKAALAADVRFLVQAGHIIEFHNGTFDLPLLPRPKEEPPKRNTAARVRDEAADSIGSDPALLSESEANFAVPAEPGTLPAETAESISATESTLEISTEHPVPIESNHEAGLTLAEPSPELDTRHETEISPVAHSGQEHVSEEQA